jgi:hypothetical protein
VSFLLSFRSEAGESAVAVVFLVVIPEGNLLFIFPDTFTSIYSTNSITETRRHHEAAAVASYEVPITLMSR